MGRFDDFLNKAKTVANVAGKKTGEMVELSKLKLQAVQLNSDIQKGYERLGAIVYEQEKTGTDNSDLIRVCISEIDALLVALNELNDKIADSKTSVKCPNCGASNPAESVFCSRCGSTLAVHDYGREVSIEVEPVTTVVPAPAVKADEGAENPASAEENN